MVPVWFSFCGRNPLYPGSVLYSFIHCREVLPNPPIGFLLDRLLLQARCDARNPAGSSACSGCVDTG